MPDDHADDDASEPFGSPPTSVDDPVAYLLNATVEVEGRMPWSSNATFLATMHIGASAHRAIYKPVRGERPLWDFEPGLDRRERAAFLLSQHLGYDCVPPTVIRDGPYGEGSFQWCVDADLAQHYFTIYEGRADLHDQLRRIAVFDVVANNTDRKSGHCLIADDKVWAIDNGLCFGSDDKLRTVIWEFGGELIDDEMLEPVAALASGIPSDIASLLSDEETEALAARAGRLVLNRRFPTDPTGRRYPWPLV